MTTNFKRHQKYCEAKGTENMEKLKKCIQCDSCSYQTSSLSDLKRHKFYKHMTREEQQMEAKFSCDKCSYGTVHVSEFKSHKFYKHMTFEEQQKEAKFKCDKCSYLCIKVSIFKRHRRSCATKKEPKLDHAYKRYVSAPEGDQRCSKGAVIESKTNEGPMQISNRKRMSNAG